MTIVASNSLTLSKVSDGVGVTSTVITYANSTSGTTAPSTGWTSEVPTVPAGSYLWTKTVWDYTDNTSETGYSVAMMGLKGDIGKSVWSYQYDRGANRLGNWWSDLKPTPTTDNPPKVGDTIIDLVGNIYQITYVVVSTAEVGGGIFDYGPILTSIKGPSGTDGTSGIIVSSAPLASPKTGQLWQDTSTTPQLVKKWTGSSWVIWELYAQNLKADKLETLSAKIGKIYNEFEYEDTGSQNKGSVTIENDIQFTTENLTNVNHPKTNIALSANTNFTGLMVQYLPINDASGGHQTAYYTYGGIYMQDNINNWNGQITAENVTLAPWQNLILRSGYTAGDGVQPQYRRIKNLDGSYSVQFRGAISPTSGNFSTTQVWAATVTGVYRPPTTAMRQCSDNTGKGGRVAITTDGGVYVMSPNNSSYVYIDSLTYIN